MVKIDGLDGWMDSNIDGLQMDSLINLAINNPGLSSSFLFRSSVWFDRSILGLF